MIVSRSVFGAVLVLVSLTPSTSFAAQSADEQNEEIAEEEERLRDLVEDVVEGLDDQDQVSTRRALEAAAAARSADRVEEQDAYARLLRRMAGLTEGGVDDRASPPVKRSQPNHLVLFASSSVPMGTLRNYAAQLERIGGTMVLRGLPGGMEKIGPFVEFTMEVLRVDPACSGAHCEMRKIGVMIDPVLFRQAGIASVPATTIVDADIYKAYCERDVETVSVSSVVYGDAHLLGHLEELDRLGDPRAADILKSYERENH